MRWVILILATLYLPVVLLQDKVLNKKKNALLIIADDAGFEIGAYGNKICQTPYLDQLAENSLLFTKAFTSVSSCSPSRSAILTGKPSHQNGMYGLHQGVHHFQSFQYVESLPKILSKHGIRTGIIGKKHVGPEDVYPFDYSETEENNSILQVGRNITNIKLLVREFLRTAENKSFFLYVGFHDPHRCGHTHPEYGEFCQHFGNGDKGMGLIPDWKPVYYQWDEIVPPYYIPNTEAAKRDIAAQYTTMSRLDQGVGIILKELENAKHMDDTLIIFSSDNGTPFPNGRTNLYDSGIGEPLLISSPFHKERRGKSTSSLVSLLDIAPTLLDWYEIPEGSTHTWNSSKRNMTHSFTGKSLLPYLLKDTDSTFNQVIYGSHSLHEVTMYYPMRMIRTQRYKLIHNINYGSPFPIDQDFYLSPTFQDILNRTKLSQDTYWFKTLKTYYYRPEWEMYDLMLDPLELSNLALQPDMTHILKQMQDRLFQWQRDTEDPWICAPHTVLEDTGDFKKHSACMGLENMVV